MPVRPVILDHQWLLHEFNGALGNAYNLIAGYKYRLANLERAAVQGTPDNHRYSLAKRIAEYRIEQTGVEDGWAIPNDSDFELADQIIKDGWIAPSSGATA